MSKGRIKERVRSAKRRDHDRMVDEIYENPEVLSIDGLSNDTVIYRDREHRYMHSLNHLHKGLYDRTGCPDVVFFCDDGTHYRFVVVEVKSNIYNSRSYDYSQDQLLRAKNYFTGMWRTVVIDQIAPLNAVTRRGDVFLDIALVTSAMDIEKRYYVSWFEKDMYLGKVVPQNGRYHFN